MTVSMFWLVVGTSIGLAIVWGIAEGTRNLGLWSFSGLRRALTPRKS